MPFPRIQNRKMSSSWTCSTFPLLPQMNPACEAISRNSTESSLRASAQTQAKDLLEGLEGHFATFERSSQKGCSGMERFEQASGRKARQRSSGSARHSCGNENETCRHASNQFSTNQHNAIVLPITSTKCCISFILRASSRFTPSFTELASGKIWPATNIAGPSHFDVASVTSHLNALSFDASTSSGPSSGFYNPARTNLPVAFASDPSRSAGAANESQCSYPGYTSEVGALNVMTPPQDFAHPIMFQAPQVQFPQDASHMSNVSSTNGSTNLWNQSATVTATLLPARRYSPPPYPPPWYPAGSVNAQSGYVGQYEGRHFAHGSIHSLGNGYNGYTPRYGVSTSSTALISGYDHQPQGIDDQFEQDWPETRFNRGEA